MKMRFRFLGLRLIIIALLLTGLFLLNLQGKGDIRLFQQAGLFAGLILGGYLLEIFLHYEGDKLLIPTAMFITAIGLVFLTRMDTDVAIRQFWWANAGLVVFYAVLWGIRDYRRMGRFTYLWGAIAIFLLAVTLLFGMTSGGARSWFRLGGFGVEPEELVKVAVLIFLSAYLEKYEEILRIGTVQWGRFSLPDKRTIGPFILMAVFSLGLLAAQKSLGTALVFFVLFVLMLYVVTERNLYLLMAGPVFLLTGSLGYVLFNHVKVRVAVWLNPWEHITGGGYQIVQSLFAIGGGGIFGTGLGNGIGAFQVPAASTDFVFAVIAEELGFAGAVALLSLFLIMVLRAFVVSTRAKERFGQIMAAGIGILIGSETLIILAGVTKLLPLTGLPLPWVSYGGNSMLVHFLLLGLLANISHTSSAGSAHLQAKGKEYAT